MQSTPNKCYNLFTFSDENTEINTIYNSVFASRFDNFADFGNWKSFVQANYKYDTVYIPFVRFANLGEINFKLPSYVAGPFEINEEKFSQFDDDLPLWIKNDSNKILFSTINKSTAFTVQNPILLTTNGFVGFEEVSNPQIPDYPDQPVQTPMSCGLSNPPAPHVHEKITHTKFRIDERYERTGKSEYNFVYVSKAYLQSNNSWSNWNGSLRKVEKKVAKDEIGDDFNFEFDVFYSNYYPNPVCIDINMLTISHLYDNNFVVAAYEHDWYGFS